jgi:serine protease inhibitor
MKTKLLIFTVVILIIVVAGCKKQDDIKPEPIILQLSEKGQKLVNSSSAFGIDLFKATVESESEKGNLMISPYSAALALAMTYNGADGETKTAMEAALRLNGLTTDDININYQQITDALLNLDPQIEIAIANSIWYRNNFPVLQDFINTNKNFYLAEIAGLDFSSPDSKTIINNWVSNKTNNRIPSIIDNIPSETVMYLINAIYFKGPWKYKFDKKDNYYCDFQLSNGSKKQVEMMSQTFDVKQFKNTNMSMVELPYGRGNWVMDLILPHDTYNVEDILDELNATTWDSWISSLSEPSELYLSMPPFKFEYEKKLNDILSGMGMGVAFDPNNADFSKINATAQLFISEVKQKTFVEVNEEGTEAAAATSVNVGVTSAGDFLIFNRPFIFVIREFSTGTILFIGKVENPLR